MQKKPLITIFTPCYNRSHTLERCYRSILKQGFTDFEWMLVDDGSVDDTEAVVHSFIKENKIKIRYFKQSNQGKQAAWNFAVQHADGQFFIGLDSDDTLIEHALQSLLPLVEQSRNESQIIGIRCEAIRHSTRKQDGISISSAIKKSDWFHEFSKRKHFGERIDILKTEYLQKFLYPVNDSIRFIPEAWFYAETASEGFKFYYTPSPLSLFFDNETSNRLSLSLLKEHAAGHYIARANMLNKIPLWVWAKNPLAYIKTIIRFSQTARIQSIDFSQRKKDSGFFYATISYILFFF